MKQTPAAVSKTWETGVGVLQLGLLTPINYATGKDYLTAEGNLKGMIQTIKGVPGLSGIYTTLRFFENNELTGDQNWLDDMIEDLRFH